MHDIGDADPTVDQVLPVGIGHAGAPVDLVADHTRRPKRRVEAVAGVREVGLGGSRPQTGVDADEQQLQSGTDEVGHGRVGERLQLGPCETHQQEGRSRGQGKRAGRWVADQLVSCSTSSLSGSR